MVAYAVVMTLRPPWRFERIFWQPASSRIRRADPPAMIPVPSAAGWIIIRVALNFVSTWYGTVPFTSGTFIIVFFAEFTAFSTAIETSCALPRPKPTFPARSPMTTAARKRSWRPPLVTFVTRETWRSTSSNSFLTGSKPLFPPRRSSRRPPPDHPPCPRDHPRHPSDHPPCPREELSERGWLCSAECGTSGTGVVEGVSSDIMRKIKIWDQIHEQHLRA